VFDIRQRSRHGLGWFAAAGMLVVALTPALANGPALVFDAEDGRVLFAEEPETPWYPASLTKLMTAYIAFDALKKGTLTPQTQFTLSDNALAQPKSRVGIRGGRKITLDQALKGLIIHSANDYAVAIAELMEGTESAFVDRMNQTALSLGMVQTQFVNANGLPSDGQATTARDMALLAKALIHQFPEQSPVFAMESAQMGRMTIHSHNDVLKTLEGGDGMKTGFTCGAGYNVVASATRKGRKIVAVVLGERNGRARTTRANALIEAAFATPLPPGPADETIDLAPVSGESLVDAPPAFALAQNASMTQNVRKCFGPPPAPRKPKDVASPAVTSPGVIAPANAKPADIKPDVTKPTQKQAAK
jgi:D-alanyl-D-alanine carboxypeptidase